MFSIETIQTNTGSVRAARVMPDAAVEALIELGRCLQLAGYGFTAVTPLTHQRINQRAAARQADRARDLRDVFGWNRRFAPELLPARMLDLLSAAQQLRVEGGLMQSNVRFASLEGRLFVHSAFRSEARDAVGFGPETYRYCALVERWAPPHARCVVELSAGTGAGAILYGSRAAKRVAVDHNPTALAFAKVNAALNGQALHTVRSDLLSDVDCVPDLILANPSFVGDRAGRRIGEGASLRGESLPLRIVSESISRLPSGGQLILYARVAVVAGVDTFLQRLNPLLSRLGAGKRFDVTYQEVDPDVFGEDLIEPPYAEIDRVGMVALHIRMA